jgi:carbonic anhydrase/acetyltransferase-like protein (isoleucine patch superfamily)
MLLDYQGHSPKLGANVFIAPDASVIGDVVIGEESSVYFCSVLRGDILPIIIGARTNIQEHCIIHTQTNTIPSSIGDETTIGHRVTIHSASIGNRCLIGMGAILLDEAQIGDEAIIGAGSLVTKKTIIPPRTLAMGSPAKVIRELRADEISYLKISADRYVERSKEYLQSLMQR